MKPYFSIQRRFVVFVFILCGLGMPFHQVLSQDSVRKPRQFRPIVPVNTNRDVVTNAGYRMNSGRDTQSVRPATYAYVEPPIPVSETYSGEPLFEGRVTSQSVYASEGRVDRPIPSFEPSEASYPTPEELAEIDQPEVVTESLSKELESSEQVVAETSSPERIQSASRSSSTSGSKSRFKSFSRSFRGRNCSGGT